MPDRWSRATNWLCGVAATALISVATASAAAADTTGWTTSGTKILTPAGGEFIITGINWYGFETKDTVAHGLWSKDYKYIINEIKQYGFNTIRLPFSNEMWETNPVPRNVAACAECSGKTAHDIMAMIINYAGSKGLHVILDNHRSTAGNSAQESGLWYTSAYPEQAWIRDWVNVQAWLHGIRQGTADTVVMGTLVVGPLASDGLPTVIGFDLRNEPHTPSTTSYLGGSTWGSGDGIDPNVNPNPNPFTPPCVATSTCHDWRLAAERAGTTILGEALNNGWEYPLIFVEGVGLYPRAGGTAADGPYAGYWWGGNLLGVNGNATNPGAPIVLNAGGDPNGLRAPVYNQVVYSAHDYGPALYRQSWFNSSTCYTSGCSASSLADIWTRYWAHLTLPAGINPAWPGHAAYPWENTGHVAIGQAPVYVGEFGTANADSDLYTTGAGSQGQWMTDIVNFIQSSYFLTKAPLNDSGIAVSDLHWTYWALNDEDSYAVLGAQYAGLENPKKEYSFLCFIQQGLLAVPMGSTAGSCSSTGALPAPDGGAAPPPPVVAPAAPTGLTATAADARVTLSWSAVVNATDYNVKYRRTSDDPYTTIATGITTTNYSHTGLTNGMAYYYVVSATNSAGESANSDEASATPTATAPGALTLSIGWPIDDATLSGTQKFKARMENMTLTDYRMYWQVDDGRLDRMSDSYTDGPHKEASVNVSSWTWSGNGPYVVNFVAKDRRGRLLTQKSVRIYVAP